MEEFRLDNPPTDCISCLRFSDNSNLLACSSWDGTVSLYDADKSKLLNRFYNKAAVLCCDIIDADTVCLGGLDCTVKIYDFQKKQEHIIGYHHAAVSDMYYIKSKNWIVSCSWDKTIKVWNADIEAKSNPITSVDVPGKVYTMDLYSDSHIVVSLENRQIMLFDLASLSTAVLSRESLLKYNIRCIRFLLDGSGYIVGSIEGRAGVEYTVEKEGVKPFSFRCHRKPDAYGTDVIYPVNAIAVHPQYGTFATGGADGSVNIWDAVAKKRLAYFPNYTPGVACLAFNKDGTKLAIGCSYTFEQGPTATEMPNSIAIRSIKPEDVLPKNMS